MLAETESPPGAADYARVARAIEFIQSRAEGQPSLAEIAEAIGVSEFHCQRLFSRWAGISPKRFLQVLTLEHAKALLRGEADVLSASYEAGLSGPGRLHDLFVTLEAVTPGEFKAAGSGVSIGYGFHPTPLGDAFIASTERGVCALEFADRLEEREEALERLRKNWPSARIERDQAATGRLAERVFGKGGSPERLSVLVRGTNFQVQVWRALLTVAAGSAVTYAEVARKIGNPRAVRAVGSAVGANPVAWLIPCHRVILSSGALGNYRGGPTRKAAALIYESA